MTPNKAQEEKAFKYLKDWHDIDDPYDNRVKPLAEILASAERDAVERCARILETKQPMASDKWSGLRLIEDNNPDISRKLYADAIRKQAIQGGKDE